MFSRSVRHVAATSIFAALLPDAHQSLVYAMDFESSGDVAMILPLPTPPGAGDDAVRFVDLSAYPDFFDDLQRAFPLSLGISRAQGQKSAGGAATLVVHAVGSFEASFVPSRGDFGRLDARFRLPEQIWEQLPGYSDWGFAVVRLKRTSGILGLKSTPHRIHPLALVFPSREPDALFFPTLHIHNQRLPHTAHFDHILYAQPDPRAAALGAWTPQARPLLETVDPIRAPRLVTAGPALCTSLRGQLPNVDVWLRPPAGIAESALSGFGAYHRFVVQAHHAFGHVAPNSPLAAWQSTRHEKIGALVQHLPTLLGELLAEKSAEWRLAPIADSPPTHFVNGDGLWVGHTYRDGRVETTQQSGVVRFRPFTTAIEPQQIDIAFRELPNPQQLRTVISALEHVLERCIESP